MQRALEPLSTGQILDRSLRLFSENAIFFLTLAALFVVPVQMLNQMAARLLVGVTEVGVTLTVSILLLLSSLVLGLLVSGALTYAISESYLGRKVTLKAALSRSWGKIGTLLRASLVAGLIVYMGVLLLVVPGIYWGSSFVCLIPAIILENQDATNARLRSVELMEGMRFKAIAIVFVVVLVFRFLGIYLAYAVLAWTGDFVLFSVAASLLLSFLFPIGWAAIVLLYYDARIRKEDFDLDVLTLSLEK